MILPAIASLIVAFPSDGARLPAVRNCYVIGATRPGETNVVVAGKNVPVYKTGAWSTIVPVAAGTNTIPVACGGETNSVKVLVPETAEKPFPGLAALAAGTNIAPIAATNRWKKLAYASDTPAPHPFGKAPGETTIVIDPGHGGGDTGALSPHAFPEKDANLRVARETRKALEKLGYKVVMTRDTDVAVELYERPKAAHTNEAAAFVSIHHNAPAIDRDPTGLRYSAVYAWNGTDRGLAREIAASVAKELEGEIPSKGVLSANFAVTRNPEIPSCLVEVDFITSPEGEEAAWNTPRRRRVGEAIARGIDAWCRKKPKEKNAGGKCSDISEKQGEKNK